MALLRDPRDLEYPRAVSSPGPSGISNHVDPSVSVSNYYMYMYLNLEWSDTGI